MDRRRAIELVRNTFENSFSEKRFIPFIKNLLNEVEINTAPILSDIEGFPDSYKPYVKQYSCLGTYTDPAGNHVDILKVELERETSPKRARTMQRNFIGWYLKNEGISRDHVLAAFYHENVDDWRFSYIQRDYRTGKDVETEKIKIEEELTPPRRFSFLVGKNEPSHTAQSQIVPILKNDKDNPTVSDIEKVFNIETVTDEFFKKYRGLFLNLKDALSEIKEENQAMKRDFENKQVSLVDFSKKLLSQIIFLYFLQKKGWLGVKSGEKWGSGSKRFLRELFSERGGKNFFNDILEPLFYEALRHDRRVDDDYYSKFDCKVPFLNGGLFDPIGNYDWVETDICLSDDLFSNNERTTQGDTGDGILDIFDRYNFTVKEDEPLEKEVAVDPEMLGKVFENLLEVKDRKSKGAYYTPREIVHYMCQESLINYLDTELDGLVNRDDFEKLIMYGEFLPIPKEKLNNKDNKSEIPESIKRNALSIDEKLASIRICDPAVGSGAFMVGMMNEIVGLRNSLSPYLQDSAERTLYNFKRDAIQDCLYGVDIDPGAVEIAKLRLWLSLVVDEQEREDIRPLPNLSYKIIQGNSLLKVEKDLFNFSLFQDLEQQKRFYFNEEDAGKKLNYQKQIDETIDRITSGRKEFDFTVYFSEVFHSAGRLGKKGFDLVIGNPPYIQLQKMRNDPLREEYKKLRYETYSPKGDIYCLFYEKGIEIVCDRGTLCYISSNKWMRAGYGKKLCGFFLRYNPKILIDLGPNIFKGATVDTNILMVQCCPNRDQFKGLTLKHKKLNCDIGDEFREKAVSLSYLKSNGKPWFVGSEAEIKLRQKIEQFGTPLKEWDISINYGIKTGYNDAFILNYETKDALVAQDPSAKEIIKPILHGKDIRRYQAQWSGSWVILAKYESHKYLEKKYPAVFNHLLLYRDKLQARGQCRYGGKGNRGQHHWLELDNNPTDEYLTQFMHDKIIWGNIAYNNSFALLEKGIYLNAPANMITSKKLDLKYLLGCLNSKIFNYEFKQIGIFLGHAFEWKKQYVEQIHIPTITSSNYFLVKNIAMLVDKIVGRQKDNYSSAMEDELNQLIYKLYNLTKEEIEIIETDDW